MASNVLDPSILVAAAGSRVFADRFPQLAIFPLRPIVRTKTGLRCTCLAGGADCDRLGKHPDWSWSKVKTHDKQWTNYDGHIVEGVGYGIATGRRSGVFVIDLDGSDAIRAFYAMGEVPRTFTVRRGPDREHLYFNMPGMKVCTTVSVIGPKIDVRGDGGYIVAPGSPHKSGDTYKIADDVPVVDAPKWLLELPGLCSEEEKPGPAPVPVVAGSPEEAERIVEAIEYLRTAKPAISGEKGHTDLWIVAQTLVRSIELPLETCYALIVEHYNERCKPPWSKREIEHKLEQARDHGHFETRTEVERFNARLLAAEQRRAS